MSTSANDARMLLYFWQEKGSPTYCSSYEDWRRNNPVEATKLEHLIEDKKWAEKRITIFLEEMVEKAEDEEESQ